MTTNNLLNNLALNSSTLRRVSLNLTQNMTDAEDLYQDTTILIYTQMHQFKSNTNFKAWAITIMRNIFFNHYRKKSRRRLLYKNAIEKSAFPISSKSTSNQNPPEENIAYQDLLNMVHGLQDDLKIPFWMAYEGYKYEEIANFLEVPTGTIKSRVFHARKKLQSIYLYRNPKTA